MIYAFLYTVIAGSYMQEAISQRRAGRALLIGLAYGVLAYLAIVAALLG